MLQPGFPAGMFGPAGPSGRGAGLEAVRGRGAIGSSEGLAQRRRVEVRRGAAAAAAAAAGDMGAAAPAAEGRGGDSWADDHEALGMSRAELEEARMMEAALLGIPYEGPPPSMVARGGGVAGGGGGRGGSEEREVSPELLEHRELRWDQDRAYEESLAADRAKEQAAARAKSEAEARERAQREAEEAAALEAAMEASRVTALLMQKTARLPAEPPASAPDAITVMVRLPDGSRHSRRFAPADRLTSLFDFVDVELDSTAKAAAATAGATAAAAGDGVAAAAAAPQSTLKPGTYNLVAQFPRRVFSENESGDKTFAEAGLAGGGGAAFFIEQIGG
ncbi:hypothetical protein GPECTOR_20g576 [Gonium pectorale]|uniref:UBX domain-containing protein n=1 Tax=Gonium pectorale TaxID=33097 RepID=A0A150GIT2_GONPE|nr:hypothetical protein GPECTOR_20g576 [Gonium pectorale]|eukprot:KXZ49719.1 hypothetical protein GPECTOR_20g576 [Gonium pectorale]